MPNQPKVRRKGELIEHSVLARKNALEAEVAELKLKLDALRKDLKVVQKENEELRGVIAGPSAEEAKFDSAFLDNLAHQLVAPLQSIESHCTNIYDGIVSGEKARRRLKEVIGHTKIISSMANRMRYLHQLTYGVYRPENVVTMQFEKLVTKLIDCHNNYLPLAEQKGITIEGFSADAMNRLPNVAADPIAVHQVMMNLFDNAIKYCNPGGEIRVTADLIDDHRFVEMVFSHPGIGVPVGEEEKIFERGYRSSTATAHRAAGTGVGLWICRRLMEAMGGKIFCVPSGRFGHTEFRLQWRIRR